MGKITILSKSSNNSYSYTDSEDSKLTANGNFEMDERFSKIEKALDKLADSNDKITDLLTQMTQKNTQL